MKKNLEKVKQRKKKAREKREQRDWKKANGKIATKEKKVSRKSVKENYR